MNERDSLIEIIERELADTAPLFGVHQHVAEELSKAVLDRLRLRLGGTECYMAKHERKKRNRDIRDKWRGDNIDVLAAEYKLSSRQIRNIVSGKQ